jgi:hypothetical protein
MATSATPVWDRWELLESPIFATLAPVIERLPEDHFPTLAELNRLCEERDVLSGGGEPLEFVPQEAKTGEPYEKRAYVYGKVLTRDRNWHDLFNALVWITFPKTKAAINRHHYREMQAREGGEARGPVRDALTLFDESGVIVASSDAGLSALLTGFQWKELFWGRREDVVGAMRFHLFGHALYEKALNPYRGITGKSVIVEVSDQELERPLPQQLAALDAHLARAFTDMRSLAAPEDYAPLPILGVPGWTPENATERYYEDTQQFRPGRARGREQPQERAPAAPKSGQDKKRKGRNK